MWELANPSQSRPRNVQSCDGNRGVYVGGLDRILMYDTGIIGCCLSGLLNYLTKCLSIAFRAASNRRQKITG